MTDRTDSYNYTHFRLEEAGRPAERQVGAGDLVADATLYRLDGSAVRLAELWEERPVVLEFGSTTCPVFVSKLEPMEALARRYAGRVDFYVVYVREAHPGKHRPPHGSLEEKLERARGLRDEEPVGRAILVDDVRGSLHRRFGGWPNSAVLIDTDGRVLFYADWCDPEALRERIEARLSFPGDEAAAAAVEMEENFSRPSGRMLATARRVFRRAGSPAGSDFVRQIPRLVLMRLRHRGP
ncbi:MAG: deiodinase-like protein [Gemmatimonadota bacterium]